ncbi:MAG: rhodanese-like domain-containing protein [Flavobacteriales bacterium]|nr:rhodanese-like domain-containing protein [Flavobacteriales bacterium]
MKSITVQELKSKMDSGEDFQLIDVREPDEYNLVNIDGELMPLGQILDFTDKVSKDKPVIVQCKSGRRSQHAIMQLEAAGGFDNLYNLEGGILAYAEEIDLSLPTY